ncbi:MAG: hypothetical protein RJA19_1691, partial [Bacteroidota bacterium]
MRKFLIRFSRLVVLLPFAWMLFYLILGQYDFAFQKVVGRQSNNGGT